MGELVRITDVSPRDGLQNEPGVIPAAQKARLVELLCASGVDEVEVTSFVSPKWVPQLGDAEEVLGLIQGIAGLAPSGAGSTPSPSGRGRGEGLGDQYPHAVRIAGLTSRARTLRQNRPVPERLLWSKLRGDQLFGLRFRQQHVFGPYVVDFYCPAAHLVIELDGQSHSGARAKQHDAARTRYLNSLGLRVIRFTDDEVIRSLDSVVSTIAGVIRSPLPCPPPEGEGVRRATDRTSMTGRAPLPCPLPEGEGVRQLPVLSVLVPNEKGFEKALEIHRSGLPLKVAFFTAASETFSKRNTNATIVETIERFRPLVPRALDEGMWVRVYISCAVACPFEGAIAPEAVRRVADMAVALAGEDSDLVEIDLGDTIGVAHPHEIERLIAAMSEEQRDRLTLHLHDTFGRAAACVRAGLAMGVRSFDGSVAGLGGCPYASTPGRRAPGNISTELLVRTVREAGYDTMVDDAALEASAVYAREIVDASRAPAGGTS